MSKARNKELQKFYNAVYKKGERKHYNSLFFSGDTIPPAKAEALQEISWEGKRVLDAGCGTGELAYEIAKRGAKKVVGVDYSKEAICAAKEKYVHSNLEYRCEDLSGIKEMFDVVVSLGTLEHLDDPYAALKNLQSRLLASGSMIITCPSWTNVRGYILMALKFLFHAPITRADLHYFTPIDFEVFAKRLKMKLSWRTVEQEWGHGEKMLNDFSRRLPNVFRDMGIKSSEKKITAYLAWLEKNALPFEKDTRHGGAVALYHLKK